MTRRRGQKREQDEEDNEKNMTMRKRRQKREQSEEEDNRKNTMTRRRRGNGKEKQEKRERDERKTEEKKTGEEESSARPYINLWNYVAKGTIRVVTTSALSCQHSFLSRNGPPKWRLMRLDWTISDLIQSRSN